MRRRLREYWREFRHAPPGDRFRSRYRRRERERLNGESQWSRPLLILGALLCMGIATPLMILPGPAIFFWALAGFLVAGESTTAAKWLDLTELTGRQWINRWKRRRSQRR